jgi:hypothetical protein
MVTRNLTWPRPEVPDWPGACLSPTLFHWRGYRFFFFSREETRPHVHVCCADGEAKFWLEPTVELARSYGLRQTQLRVLQRQVEDRRDDILDRWRCHFPG